MPTIQFGVHISEGQATDPIVTKSKRRYTFLCAAISAPLVISSFFVYGYSPFLTVIVWPFLDLVALFAVYYAFRLRILSFKKENKQSATSESSVAVVEGKPTKVSPILFLLPWVEVSVFVLVGLLYYPIIPSVFATHYGANGQPNAYAQKTYLSVFTLLIFVAVPITALLEGLSLLFPRIRPFQNPVSPRKTAKQMAGFNRIMVYFMLLTIIVLNLTMFLSSAIEWGLVPKSYLFLSILPVFFILAAVLVVALKAGQGGWKLYPGATESPTDATPTNDDSLWRAGVVYYNRDDSSLLVPKRFGVGYSLNFAHPVTWVVLASPFAVLVLVILFSLHLL